MNVDKIVSEYIEKSLHMSLATTNDNKPWVCEVHFVYDDNFKHLYFRSLKSRRHSQDIAKNPNVAGNIVRQHGQGEYPHAIYFEGQASPIEDEAERQKLFPRFQKRLQVNETILEDAKKEDGHHFYKIAIENWYAFGKFDQDHGGKFKLDW